MESIKKPIVIVGAGFAGMTFALNLKNINPSLPILVVDSETNFIFKPLMYEVLSEFGYEFNVISLNLKIIRIV